MIDICFEGNSISVKRDRKEIPVGTMLYQKTGHGDVKTGFIPSGYETPLKIYFVPSDKVPKIIKEDVYSYINNLNN